ncbi:MerR family transcriptional regulator [Naumannella sp. ID2617S]|nr:MerR family transcriptional regulator [Naumannella sp. ID2617S]
MYTIGQAARRTGVSADTLRAWERRYGFPTPARTQARYRLYDEAALAQIRRMTRLLAEGLQAREAALIVGARDDAGPRLTPAAFIKALEGPHSIRQLEKSFACCLQDRPFVDFVDNWMVPMLGLLGRAWLRGRVSIGGEHGVSAAIMRQLGLVWDALPQGDGPMVLIGLPAGARHEICLLAFAILLKEQGIRVLYLGADLPAESWAEAVIETRARVVVTGVHRPEDVPSVEELIVSVTAAGAQLIALGGRYQGDVSGSALRLGNEFGPAVDRFGRHAAELHESVAEPAAG